MQEMQDSIEVMTSSKGAIIEANGQIYPLKEGVNIVGRKTMFPMDIDKIEIDDRTISRYHCKILLKTLPNGTQKAVLTPYQNNINRICVDGNYLSNVDAVYLFDGSQIQLGKTVATFRFL